MAIKQKSKNIIWNISYIEYKILNVQVENFKKSKHTGQFTTWIKVEDFYCTQKPPLYYFPVRTTILTLIIIH